MIVAEVFDTFIEGCKSSLSPNTLRAYRSDLAAFSSEFPHLQADQVTVHHLRAFLQSSMELAPSTLARRQASLRSAFSWAYRNDLLASDPTGKLDPIRLPVRDPRPLTEAQAEAILSAIPPVQRRNRLIFTLLYETGMRVGEALQIRIQDVNLNDLDGGYIRIVGKGDRERLIPLIDAPRSVRLLRGFIRNLGATGPLFRGDLLKGGRSGEPVEYATLYYHFEKYLEIARKRQADLFSDPEPVTIHRFRHTFATMRLRDGVSLQSVRKLLGHRNIQTTLRYADTDIETLKLELVEARRRRKQRGRK